MHETPESIRNELERKIEMKVSWVAFGVFVTIFLAIVGYLSTTDTKVQAAVDKNEDRFYQYQQDTNKILTDMTSQISAISQKLGVKAIK